MGAFKKHKWKVLASLVFVPLIAFFLAFGPPKLLARTETPSFCASCHVMQSEFEAWFNAGAHRNARCVDCHLPHQTLPLYYTWKSIDGMKDVIVFYSGHVPESIEVSQRGKRFIQSNCIRCHSEKVAMIDQERNCWECHRFLQHRLTGARLTN